MQIWKNEQVIFTNRSPVGILPNLGISIKPKMRIVQGMEYGARAVLCY